MAFIRGLKSQFFLSTTVFMAVGTFSLFIADPAWSQQAFKYKYFAFTAMGNPMTRLLVDYTKEAKEATKNQLDIRVYPQGELPYQPSDAVDISSKGVVDLANGEVSYIAGEIPIAPLISLPLLVRSKEEALKAGKPFMARLDKAIQEKYNAKLLWWFTWPNRKIIGKGKVPQSLADLKGKKIRFPGPIGSEFLSRLGMVPVNINPGDVPVAIQRGTLDGTSGAYVFLQSSKWHEFCNWGYEIECGAVYNLTLINKNAYEKLSPEMKNVLSDLGNKYQAKCTDFGYSLEDRSRENFQKSGITFVKPTEKDFEVAKEKILPFWNEWSNSKGAPAVEALKEIRQAVGR